MIVCRVLCSVSVSSATPGERTVTCIVFSQLKSSWLYRLTGAAGFIMFILVVRSLLSWETWNRMWSCDTRAWMLSYLFLPWSAASLFSRATNSRKCLSSVHFNTQYLHVTHSPFRNRVVDAPARFSCVTFPHDCSPAFAHWLHPVYWQLICGSFSRQSLLFCWIEGSLLPKGEFVSTA